MSIKAREQSRPTIGEGNARAPTQRSKSNAREPATVETTEDTVSAMLAGFMPRRPAVSDMFPVSRNDDWKGRRVANRCTRRHQTQPMRNLRFRETQAKPAQSTGTRWTEKNEGRGVTPKPYLYAEELAELVPWSVEAIRKKVQRAELQLGVHYFQERHRARLIFKWATIVDLIERGSRSDSKPIPTRAVPTRRRILDIEKATAELQRLLAESTSATEAVERPQSLKR